MRLLLEGATRTVIVADSSPQWLPLVLAPVALVGWIGVLYVLFVIAAWIQRIRIHPTGVPIRRPSPAGPPVPVAPPIPAPDGQLAREKQPTWGRQVDRTGQSDWPDREQHLYSAGGISRGNVIAFIGLMGGLVAAAGVLQFPRLDPKWAAVLGAVVGCLLSLSLVLAYERWAWRWVLIAHFRLSKIPDLNGEWDGHIEVDKGLRGETTNDAIQCRVRIKQDWSRIAIDFITNATESWSVMATIDARRLHYEYFVVPRPPAQEESASEQIKPHDGMARLTPTPRPGRRERCWELNGRWFNDQSYFHDKDSLRWGTIHLARVDR
jgi:hypothetical protein